MAAEDSTTVVAPRRWSLRTLAEPSGINFMLGLFAGPSLFEFIEAMRRGAWSEAAVPFMILATFLFAASAYTAGFKAVTADVKREA
jgi:hypothetical protein